METKQLESYKARLLEMRRWLMHEVDASEEALRQDVMTPGDTTAVPTHPADQDAEGLDVEIAIAQNEERMLEEVEEALARIEELKFGICQECGREIGAPRLEAIPYASRCIDCAKRHDDAGQPEPPVRGEPRRLR